MPSYLLIVGLVDGNRRGAIIPQGSNSAEEFCKKKEIVGKSLWKIFGEYMKKSSVSDGEEERKTRRLESQGSNCLASIPNANGLGAFSAFRRM